jgi:long-chain acyl-CoA synthetase
VAVFGGPHDKGGETPLAAVVLRWGRRSRPRLYGAGSTSTSALAISTGGLTEALPRSAAGKTLKRELREPWRAVRER